MTGFPTLLITFPHSGHFCRGSPCPASTLVVAVDSSCGRACSSGFRAARVRSTTGCSCAIGVDVLGRPVCSSLPAHPPHLHSPSLPVFSPIHFLCSGLWQVRHFAYATSLLRFAPHTAHCFGSRSRANCRFRSSSSSRASFLCGSRVSALHLTHRYSSPLLRLTLDSPVQDTCAHPPHPRHVLGTAFFLKFS